jgi:endonuclease/exonuclease/phosphatase family metal-dependent hydrolase
VKAALRSDLDRIGNHLATISADVISLQEVDWEVRRSGSRRQAEELGRKLGMRYVFAGAHEWQGGDYGLAVLSKFPLIASEVHRLPIAKSEPRILLQVDICVGSQRLRLFDHHADTTTNARKVSFARLVPMLAEAVGEASVLAADLNEAPKGPGVKALLASGYVDPFATQNLRTTASTRVDYVLLSPVLFRSLHETKHWPTKLSDHDALSVDVNWP